MAALHLDLTESVARLARAQEVLASLHAEIDASLAKDTAYTLRVVLQPGTNGWFSVFLVPQYVPDPHFGILCGEFFYNLRCALDYAVTALVRVSPAAALSSKHQFPVYETRTDYVGNVEKPAARGKGPLGQAVERGSILVEELQPYHQPEPRDTAVWIINHFCNRDKHREIAAYVVRFGAGSLRLQGCQPAESRLPGPLQWEPGKECWLGDFRLDPPYPSAWDASADYTIHIGFRASGVRSEPCAQALDLPELGKCCNRVGEILARFSDL